MSKLDLFKAAMAAGLMTCGAAAADAPTPAPSASPMEAISAKLPLPVADAARKWLRGDDKEIKALSGLSPESLEQEVMVSLAAEQGAAGFVLERLASETPATVRLILKTVAFDAFWLDVPGVDTRLKDLAGSTADPELMLAYLDAARRIDDRRLHRILTARIADARKSGDLKALAALAPADERWVMIDKGATIPGYMRRPPAVLEVKPGAASIRVVGMGDFGTGTQGQRDVALAIIAKAKEAPFDFGITFGDNFYQTGMESTDDPRWHDWWESIYGPLAITFYPSLGNHEWYSDDGAVAEIAYKSPTWRFPAPYYTFTAGPVQFFVVDTTDISEAEVIWLDKAIAASTSRWKVVYGHHPIFAPEKDGKSGRYMAYMQARLWPVIRGRVDAYLCGHQHAMAQMEPRDGVHFFMSGGGGAPLGKVSKKAAGIRFAESEFGFLTLEAGASSLSLEIYDAEGKTISADTVSK